MLAHSQVQRIGVDRVSNQVVRQLLPFLATIFSTLLAV